MMEVTAPIKGARLKKMPVLKEPNPSKALMKNTRLIP
jgi:hypothetical protein